MRRRDIILKIGANAIATPQTRTSGIGGTLIIILSEFFIPRANLLFAEYELSFLPVTSERTDEVFFVFSEEPSLTSIRFFCFPGRTCPL